MVRVRVNENRDKHIRDNNKSIELRKLFVMVVATVVVCGNVAEGIGINWGTMMAQPLYPEIVVKMLKDNGIKQVKLFDADPWTVKPFAGTGIQLMLAIPNNELERFSEKYSNAKDWVAENVTSHLKDQDGVDIRYVAVGNEPFLKAYNGSHMKTLFPALQNIQKALDEAGVGNKIKATVPSNADVYESASGKPSDGNFRKDIRQLMVDIVKYLNSKKAPFVVNIYPFLSLYMDANFPYEYAFFDQGSTPTQDGKYQYTNVFDANYDTLVHSLKKSGVPDLEIIVGEIGWPTDGDKQANVKNAKKFYDGFFKKKATKKGTPLRANAYEEVYLFGLFDENMKSVAPGNFERHWGILRYDGQPKFPMDFSGKGDDKMMVGAKGVQYLQSQWCVYNKESGNVSAVAKDVDYACSLSDCTALGYGCSCNNLDVIGNISYAYNMYFQMQAQDVQACDFEGTAKIVKVNASQKGCLFPIQIASTGHRVQLILMLPLMFFFFITLVL
ncbi:glucan endo-1,3-beta-glucosidase 8-like [Macadamia integrifolia]|uniref:glucan endo-1,3-beta-glucosidase 8-like n=1 Tax=Macadamia integrifolia TaxID=60698 RepID=UPI001C4F2680|nr:glucan endo-1,3-beta-glucosidase 8-like [Macadamia integrifolia]